MDVYSRSNYLPSRQHASEVLRGSKKGSDFQEISEEESISSLPESFRDWAGFVSGSMDWSGRVPNAAFSSISI